MVPITGCIMQPIRKGIRTMTAIKTSRLALFAAATVVAIGALAGTTRPSAALDLSWVSNTGYVNCLRNAHAVAMRYRPQERAAIDDTLRRACNRGYFPNRPGVQY
jgi:uncharacterized membrane protein YcgQ (UPF0703/DUF1980 family)